MPIDIVLNVEVCVVVILIEDEDAVVVLKDVVDFEVVVTAPIFL
ncbi:MAG: hypothetical protein QXW69_07310 [Nitrososphaerota archaeon]